MKRQQTSRSVLFCSMIAVVMLPVDAGTQSRGRGIYGDWLVKIDVDGRQYDSVLSFSRDRDRNWTGQWISFFGVSELKDLKLEDGQLSFKRDRRNRDGETRTSTFKGTIKDGKLSGTLSSDRGDYSVEGKRGPRSPRAVGNWDLKFKIGDREITNTLAITANPEGKLTVVWQSRRVEHKVTDVKYERGKLTFKSQSKMDDREWESTFDGTIERDALSGAIKSDRGEIAVEGKRVGADLIGVWNLEVESERGNRRQRLRVNRDMSGLYGALAIKKIDLKDGKVSFKSAVEFGGQTYEWSFQGTLKDSKLAGELTSARGSRKVTGTKVLRNFRRGGTRSRR